MAVELSGILPAIARNAVIIRVREEAAGLEAEVAEIAEDLEAETAKVVETAKGRSADPVALIAVIAEIKKTAEIEKIEKEA